jgi:hypothetical protein
MFLATAKLFMDALSALVNSDGFLDAQSNGLGFVDFMNGFYLSITCNFNSPN